MKRFAGIWCGADDGVVCFNFLTFLGDIDAWEKRGRREEMG